MKSKDFNKEELKVIQDSLIKSVKDRCTNKQLLKNAVVLGKVTELMSDND